MTSQVFYRKWRPQTLGEVVGQEHVTKTLLNALATKRVAHAYLFCGPRGTGKTTTGRLLAKAVNCLNNEFGDPCNTCEMCRAVNEGRAIDLIEIDAASNRGIDDIRDLREKVNFSPNIARYKVYIIDEVHMLTDPAFNALLKTLEEPPSQVIFVLATTEIHKVPLTIISRCQRFDFRRIPRESAVKRLQYICDKEGIQAEPQALTLIAKIATGSLRDAENLLEQMLISYGSEFTLHDVQEELGFIEDVRVSELAKHILTKDVATGLKTINSVRNDGLDLRQFSRQLVEYLREILLVKAGAESALDLSPENIAERKEVGDEVSLQEITKAIKLFSELDFRLDPQSPLPLEIALVDSSLLPEKEEESDYEVPEDTAGSDLEKVRRHWDDFVDACREYNRNIAAVLQQVSKLINVEDGTITLGFQVKNLKEKIEEHRQEIEEKAKEVFGTPYKIQCVLVEREGKPKKTPLSESKLVKTLEEKYGARRVG